MSTKPIFVATHPRACSTAFERVFMTRTDILNCVHEPFGDAFYYGPERLSSRYEEDSQGREGSGFSNSTYKTIFEKVEKEAEKGKRLFIKDITHYLVPPEGKPATIAPSLSGKSVKKGVGTNGVADGEVGAHTNGEINGTNGSTNGHSNGHTNGHNNGHTNGTQKTPYPYNTEAEPGNPTVVPKEILQKFHFAFLIRHPRSSIPSYYHCTIPPQSSITGFYNFMPSEAGYDELRRVFDYLKNEKQVGPSIAGEHGELRNGEVSITVVDADDLLDNPNGIIKAFCEEVGIDYSPEMLKWGDEESQKRAKDAFEKWPGFHTSAINSTALRPRAHKKKEKSVETEDEEWRNEYGVEGAKAIRECVNANLKDYEYLKSFALKAKA